jgi:hypothetical protein
MKLQESAGLRTTSKSVLGATLLLLAPSLALTQAPKGNQNAQSGGMQTTQTTPAADISQGVKVGKVYLTGENPVIRLLDNPDGKALTFVSYWAQCLESGRAGTRLGEVSAAVLAPTTDGYLRLGSHGLSGSLSSRLWLELIFQP